MSWFLDGMRKAVYPSDREAFRPQRYKLDDGTLDIDASVEGIHSVWRVAVPTGDHCRSGLGRPKSDKAIPWNSLEFESLVNRLPPDIESPSPLVNTEIELSPAFVIAEAMSFDVKPRVRLLSPFVPTIATSDLLNGILPTIHPITEFRCILSHFTFGPLRAEPQNLFSKAPNAAQSAPRVARITEPPMPPCARKASIEERLRWILTPPIHEILSDPQLALPERPFPYQMFGVKWLKDRDSALLADEMGLGKTMQAIIAARLLWREGRIKQVLVVCPKMLISNWKEEFRKWWPQAAYNIMVADQDRQWFLRMGTPSTLVKIINYESLGRELDWLKTQTFSHDLVIIDEAQRIKNPKAKASQAVKFLKAGRRWALTGTPLENKVEDVISIFGYVNPELLVACDLSNPITEHIRPFMLRRRTEEVMPELPEKYEQDVEIELDDAHRETYNRLEREGVLELNEKGDQITVTHVFALINRLRQVCNFDPQKNSSAKLERLLADLEEIRESGKKALVFSQFVSEKFGLRRLSSELGKEGYGVRELHGGISTRDRDANVQWLKSDPDANILLLNFAVGGVGLNLQAANYVYLFDRWWNPAVEDQAVKRAHRIGQMQKVFIRRFYCGGTIEERILEALAKKRQLFRQIIDEASPQADSMGLNEEEIFSLFNLTVRPRKSAKPKISVEPVTLILNNMDPKQFEELVAELYEKQGFSAALTGGSHDGGIDVLAERQAGGARERVIIQCKHQRGKVGRPVLQQLWGVLHANQSYTRADCVTSSTFTPEAQEFAKEKRLTLIDRTMLEQLASEFRVASFVQLPPTTQ